MTQARAATRPPEVIDLGDVALVRSSEVSPAAVYAAVDASRAHLEPWMAWAAGYTLARAREFVLLAEQGWEDDLAYDFCLVEPSGAVAGTIGMHRRIGEGGLEIGYWVRAEREGRGLVTRACKALVDAAFALPDIDRVEIRHDAANSRSAAVPGRLGFTELGRDRREPEAPACLGVEVAWRLTRAAYGSRGGPA